MAELADAADSKSAVLHCACRFDPDFRHHLYFPTNFLLSLTPKWSPGTTVDVLTLNRMRKKWNFYVKVLVIEEEEGDVNTERVTREITRQLQKIYGVRSAEVTSVTTE